MIGDELCGCFLKVDCLLLLLLLVLDLYSGECWDGLEEFVVFDCVIDCNENK